MTEESMTMNQPNTDTQRRADGGQLSPEDARALLDGEYVPVDILPNGEIAARGTHDIENVTRTLKEQRRYYAGALKEWQ